MAFVPPYVNETGAPLAVNRHWYPDKKPPTHAIYLGRGTALGNPYTVKQHGDSALQLYRCWLWQKICTRDPEVMRAFAEIKSDSILVCSCKPRACHLDVVVAAWSWLQTAEEQVKRSRESQGESDDR